MTDAIKLAIEALEVACGNRCNAEYNPCQAREALAALRAQPADPFKKLSDDEVLWIAQSHGIDVYASNPLAFYADLISTTPAQPDHSELARKLRALNPVGDSFQYVCDVTNAAADALEGNAIGGKA